MSGSDLAENAATRRLARAGRRRSASATRPSNVDGADAVVVSTAVQADNPEVIARARARIPVVPRALMLAELMRLKQGIAIAGTHGKTTTTSLVASVLAEGGLDPTFVIGGRLNAAGANARLGSGDFIVVEADESDASFLHLQPVIAVVTNIDADHMETYEQDFAQAEAGVRRSSCSNLPFYGAAVLCVDDPHVREILPLRHRSRCVTYGTGERRAICAPTTIAHDGGRMRFRAAARDGARALDVTLNLPGRHNVLNALAAIAVADELGVPDAAIRKALAEFHGVGRRFQRYGEVRARERRQLHADRRLRPPSRPRWRRRSRPRAAPFPGGASCSRSSRIATRARAICSRISCSVLSTADALLLADVYPAGEAPIVAADGRALARAVRVAGKVEPVFVEDIGEMPRRDPRASRATATWSSPWAPGSIGNVPGAAAHEHGRAARNSSGLRGELRRDEPMARHVSWRAGGPADRFYVPADLDDLGAFLRQLPRRRAGAVRRPRLATCWCATAACAARWS